MKFKLFVYATLKKKHNQIAALGHTKVEVPAILQGYREIEVSYKGEMWPTIWSSPYASIGGDILTVSGEELKELDNWESNYKRQLVQTTKGRAWVYLFRRPK